MALMNLENEKFLVNLEFFCHSVTTQLCIQKSFSSLFSSACVCLKSGFYSFTELLEISSQVSTKSLSTPLQNCCVKSGAAQEQEVRCVAFLSLAMFTAPFDIVDSTWLRCFPVFK